MSAQNLDQAIANLELQLQEITASPKPSYSLPDGNSLQWGEFHAQLLDALDKMRTQRLKADGSFEIQ